MILHNYKMWLAVCVSIALTAVPQNIIGCADGPDPFDYYTSFFSKENTSNQEYKPFLYTARLIFYDDWSMDETPMPVGREALVQEWQAYTGPQVLPAHIDSLVFEWPLTRLTAPAAWPNTMMAWIQQNKRTDVVQYLSLAKTIEPFCAQPDAWTERPKADSIKMNQWLAHAEQRYNATTDAFLKAKWGYLCTKIAFYNNRFAQCTDWYNKAFANAPASQAKWLAMSYMGGSQLKLGRSQQAALHFSRLFAASPRYRKQHYLSFFWCTNRANPSLANSFVNAAPTPEDKANLQAMFALHGTQPRLPELENIFQWQPNHSALPILAIREINKLEEQYLTPKLQAQPGAKGVYDYTDEANQIDRSLEKTVEATSQFFEKLAKTPQIAQPGLYAAGAAYLSYMKADYTRAKSLLEMAGKLPATPNLTNQIQLIELLLATQAATTQSHNESFANSLVPQWTWLRQMAQKQPAWHAFYRDYFAQIVAPAYQQKGLTSQMILAYGVADASTSASGQSQDQEDYYLQTQYAQDYLQRQITEPQAEALFNLMTTSRTAGASQFLIAQSAVKPQHVANVLATLHMRNQNLPQAIAWYQKAGYSPTLTAEVYQAKTYTTKTVNIDPFHDYLNDWQRYDKTAKTPFTKLSFAKALLQTTQALDTAKTPDTQARLYYQLASAWYNMSFYGNSWTMMDYYRPSSAWNNGNYEKPWHKEYFGVEKAMQLYQKAYQLSTNKEFKAAAYFLMAKCAQRQLPRPEYGHGTYEQYEQNTKAFTRKFKNNPYFAGFVKEFGATKFYQYTYNRCSYLRDFVAPVKAKK